MATATPHTFRYTLSDLGNCFNCTRRDRRFWCQHVSSGEDQ